MFAGTFLLQGNSYFFHLVQWIYVIKHVSSICTSVGSEILIIIFQNHLYFTCQIKIKAFQSASYTDE